MSRELKMEVTSVFDRNYDAYITQVVTNSGDSIIKVGDLLKIDDIREENYILKCNGDKLIEYKDKYRFIWNQGGSRSGKSISILQLLILIALQEKKKITICRKTLTACKQIKEDFFNLLNEYDLYTSGKHNKMENSFTFYNGSSVEFIGVDNDLKLRGMKRDILFCNEVNELDFDEWLQLNLRTSGKIICDFNPSDPEHFIYDLMKQENSVVIKSTYKDNPFLTRDQIEYIENLINVDHNYYLVYVMGQIPTSTTRVYNHFKQFIDEPINIDTTIYGLDIGFNHPSAMVECKFIDNRVYVRELIYERNLTSVDLINRIKNLGIDKNRDFYVDSARPDIIEDLRRAGFYKVRGADKQVVEGIDSVKSMEVFIHHESINLWKEYKLYSWKSNGDIISDKEVVKEMDDALDALRYGVFSYKKNKKVSKRSWYIG
jgi:phage terminase large subunit